MTIEKERPASWLRDNRGALPSIITGIAVALFWAGGGIGWIRHLAGAESFMALLTGLYIALATVAVSVILATLALTDLAGRYARPRNRRHR
ncbi:hypothetical protein C4K88_04155 [Arthrobacter pityocampae]|uniref:Uncharacterized protein n=1 Tax=Arthrobacter pityocampae TaxID=547334 RepID=A0A2S5IZD3_9MICC|nr:hypothetical protein [Arthrobacter pityocampae]PPB49891.1 hypothetical protein C4K88_04155 [Arthrobacter pityocampae]